LIKPNWNGGIDKQNRVLFYAQGSYEAEGANPVISYILLEKTQSGQIHFALRNPELNPSQLDRSTLAYQWSPESGYQRVTFTWDKDPQKTQLYVNGNMAFDMKGPSSGGGGYGMMPGMPGSKFQTPTVPLPHSISEIYVGARPDGTESADALIDNLRILNYAIEGPELNDPIEYKSETTLLMDYFQTPFVDTIGLPGNYLSDALDDLRECIRMETSPAANKSLVEMYTRKKETIKRSIGLDRRSFAGRSNRDRFLVELLSADQMTRILAARDPSTHYDLDEILRLLQVSDHEPKEYGKQSLIGFLDLVVGFLDLGIESNLASIKTVRIQGETVVVSDDQYRTKFEEEFQKLGEATGMQMRGGIPGGGGGYPGMGYSGGGGYPGYSGGGGYPGYSGGGGYPGYSGGGGYPGYSGGGGYPGYSGGGGYPGYSGGGGYPGYSGGGGYPGAGYPGGGGYSPGGMTAPGASAISQDFQDMAAQRAKFMKWKEAYDSGTIPPDFYEELAKKEQASAEIFYTRRILDAKIAGKIDYVPEFLYKLEFGDPLRKNNNLVSFSQLALAADESSDLLDCSVTVNVHYISNEPVTVSETEKEKAAETSSATTGGVAAAR
jgi:hypothetical protein